MNLGGPPVSNTIHELEQWDCGSLWTNAMGPSELQIRIHIMIRIQVRFEAGRVATSSVDCLCGLNTICVRM